ncbi:hypothetical protein GUITHDRAFT_109157 [Guillardia theta CCMP2712]|uniref:Uncharacterized protein n=1 Tax=Guillardia theta (strain CCMP2712) TaxID=905079 RepID=L1J980_GUITC|nr:hypothetical protein GUITHDRAFT_109157 [Guillardia theta CCMP2712]EKX45113.1 hypothetical protein GUITHDRAFT_109157 [Guillardia theta CCMP2712]|eukprot:XP_005832093.1 hypothetical protein GUITHDRAFT_109157 [Guillardia theta CCMP2712]
MRTACVLLWLIDLGISHQKMADVGAISLSQQILQLREGCGGIEQGQSLRIRGGGSATGKKRAAAGCDAERSKRRRFGGAIDGNCDSYLGSPDDATFSQPILSESSATELRCSPRKKLRRRGTWSEAADRVEHSSVGRSDYRDDNVRENTCTALESSLPDGLAGVEFIKSGKVKIVRVVLPDGNQYTVHVPEILVNKRKNVALHASSASCGTVCHGDESELMGSGFTIQSKAKFPGEILKPREENLVQESKLEWKVRAHVNATIFTDESSAAKMLYVSDKGNTKVDILKF